MAAMWKPKDPAVLRAWCDEIMANGRGLTAWEDEFIEGIDDMLCRDQQLSEKQEEILERIYAERT